MTMEHLTVLIFLIAAVILLKISIRIVPQKQAAIVERLGKYNRTLNAGMHLLVPVIDRVVRIIDLKECVMDIDPQACVTRDNIIVTIDGLLYFQVIDPVKAFYGINNYMFACEQLAQTTLRSEIGKLELDRTFEERTSINSAICSELDKASDPWGVKVTRYEIKTITPPDSVRDAMEKQMKAEREKRAAIAESEGERQSRINRADGIKQEAIKCSEGEKERRINEAAGRAEELRLVPDPPAAGLRAIAQAISENKGGRDAVGLRIAEQYIAEFGKLAKENNTMIVPSNLSDVAGFVQTAAAAFNATKKTD